MSALIVTFAITDDGIFMIEFLLSNDREFLSSTKERKTMEWDERVSMS